MTDYAANAADRGASAALDDVRTLLTSGEQLVASAIEHRVYALTHRRRIAAATTGRFIFLRRRLLGGYDPLAIRWQDLKDVAITVGMFTATVTVSYSANMSDTASDEGAFEALAVSGLKKAQAQALYRECQTQEQSWREKRRVRSMEEARARSGATQIATGVYPQAAPQPALSADSAIAHAEESPAQRLSRAKDMLAQGLISDAEYESIKARIVGSL